MINIFAVFGGNFPARGVGYRVFVIRVSIRTWLLSPQREPNRSKLDKRGFEAKLPLPTAGVCKSRREHLERWVWRGRAQYGYLWIMVNFSSFCVRYLCVASVIIINLDSSGSVKDDMIAHARLQTARTKRLDILSRSSHLNSAQMTSSAWNVWSETVSLSTTGQSFETADVVVGRHTMIYYAYFLVAEIHDTGVHRVVVQGSDVYLQDGHPLCNREFSFKDDAVLSDAFSPFDDSSLLTTQYPFLYAFLPACAHSFLSANLLFLLLPITLCRIMYGIFLQSKKQVTSISDDHEEESAGSETSNKEITEMAEKSSENKSELLLDLDSPLSRGTSNSVVYKGTLRQRPVAVKVSYRAGSYRQASREPAEVKHVKHLRHPHVVKVMMSLSNTPFKICLNSSQAPTEQTDMSYETLIVMEYCDRGSLHNALKYRLLSVPERHEHITACALEIAQAMDHVHSKRIIHGALHAKHIFLQSDITDPRGFKCKVKRICGSVKHDPLSLCLCSVGWGIWLVFAFVSWQRFGSLQQKSTCDQSSSGNDQGWTLVLCQRRLRLRLSAVHHVCESKTIQWTQTQ